MTKKNRNAEQEAFGKRLRQLREKTGMTQSELASAVGMTQQALGKYERGINQPTWPTVVKFAMVLNCTPNDFLYVSYDPDSDPWPGEQ